MGSYWGEVLNGLRANELDIPLATVYSLEIDQTPNSPPSRLHLQGTLGIGEGHPFAPKSVDLEQGTELMGPLFRMAMTSKGATIFHEGDGTLPRELLQGIIWRGFGEYVYAMDVRESPFNQLRVSSTIVILPLTAGKQTRGFFLACLNPRRAYDEDYSGFIKLLGRQLSTSLTAAVMMEQAKQKQAELSKDLAEGESRFRVLTELNNAG